MLNEMRSVVILVFVLVSMVNARSIWESMGSKTSSIGIQARATSPPSSSAGANTTTPTPPQGGTRRWVKYLPRSNGVNIAGLEFGINSNGDKNGNINVPPPLDQLKSFLSSGMNVIRIPFGWQYVQPTLKGELDPTQLAHLDTYVNAVLEGKAFAVIDLHNYARYNGQIVGQSAIGVDALIDLWTKLAKHYMGKKHVIFGLMNEPHDIDGKKWIDTVQQLVTAIRNAGSRHRILMPGNSWSHLATFADDYSSGMGAVKNPDGSNHGLIFDIHQYLDGEGSGTNRECTQNHVEEVKSVAAVLKKDGRQALVTEMGGGNTASCQKIIPEFVKALHDNYPEFAGSLGWGAGAFGPEYELILSVKKGNTWQDQMNLSAIKSAVPAQTVPATG